MSLVTGQVLNNRYRVVRLLREGGFGKIYRAWDLSLKKPCALKGNSETSPAAAEQFFREAAMLANLNHPNLPRVTDHFIIPDMGQYLVMDYVEGEDLQDVLDRTQGGLPEAQVLTWAKQVGEALTYLHSRTPPVIHRDIKPANIRITPEGKAVLVDFGIAKEYASNMATAVVAKAVTAGYSPPEQYSGAGTDNRSDIYAFGATLYSLLTGAEPPESTLRLANVDMLRSPRSLNPSISPTVENAILTAMDVNRDRRFQRVEDFMAALSTPGSQPVAPTQVVAVPGEGAMAATVAAPNEYGATGYPQVDHRAVTYDRPKEGGGGIPPWVLVLVAGGGFILLAIFGYLLFGGGDNTDKSATETRQAAIILTDNARSRATDTKSVQASATAYPTYTPLPTYTSLPTNTSAPRVEPTNTPRPPEPTDTRPPPTSAPVTTDVKVSLRNRTTGNVNMYRIGRSGERHFLGWVAPNYYGTYTFPSLGEWTIEFCARDDDGNSYNCRQKTINVTSSGQEFSVP